MRSAYEREGLFMRLVAIATLSVGIGLGLAACVGDSPTVTPLPDSGTDSNVVTTSLFVDPVKGDDTRPGGSADAPLKTIKRALLLASPGYTINLAAGVYDAGSGEDWNDADSGSDGYLVPANVTLTTPQKGGATLSGVSPKRPFWIKGGAKLINLKFTGFSNGLIVNGGSTELVGVEMVGVPWAISASQAAKVKITASNFADAPKMGPMIQSSDTAFVDIYQTTFTGNKGPGTLQALGFSEMNFNGGEIRNSEAQAFDVRENAKISVYDVKVQNNTPPSALGYVDGSKSGENAMLVLGYGVTITDNGQGLRATAGNGGKATITLDNVSIQRNGLVGISVEGSSILTSKYSTIADHTQNNIKVQSFVGAIPGADVSMGNTIKALPNTTSVDVYCSSCTGTLKFTQNTWQPSSPAVAPGTIPVNNAEIANLPHYRLNGSGYSVSF